MGFLWLRDVAAPCETVATLPDVQNAAEAANQCTKDAACEYFVYVKDERLATLCRSSGVSGNGEGYMMSRASAGSVVGVKPDTLAVPSYAVLTNQEALCPNERLLVDKTVASIEDAHRFCEGLDYCSHFTLVPAGETSTGSFTPRARFCTGGMATVPREGSTLFAKATA